MDASQHDRVERILERLRQVGGRVTTPRRAIVVALVEAPHHVTADDLAGRVNAAHPDVHQSTVYRFLDTLTDAGVVTPVNVGRGPAIFHLVEEAHAHLACRTCGTMTGIDPAVVGPLAARLQRDFGFRLETHLVLSGTCADCAGAPLSADDPVA